MSKPPKFPPIIADRDNDTVTFALTFQWRRPWAMDHCELYSLCGTIKRILRDGLTEDDWNHQLVSFNVQTWEPNEERHIGNPDGIGVGPIVLPTPPGYEEE